MKLSIFLLDHTRMVKHFNVPEKNVFFASFFRNVSKTAETILIKKLNETVTFWFIGKPYRENIEKLYFSRYYFVKMSEFVC